MAEIGQGRRSSASEEHYEFFEWLISEVTAMGGDGAFVKVHRSPIERKV